MNIKHLKFKGLTIFKDEIEIDFDSIGDGLVALVGDNGAGKTTAMEAIFAGLYRQMPSRPGSLYEHSVGKDAFIDLQLDNDQPYQALLNINNASKTMEAHLFKNGDPLCSGKTKEFDELVTKEFGPAEMVLSSAFSAQNKAGSFLTLSKADRKELFAELLGLKKLQELHEKAKKKSEAQETDLEKKQEILKLKEEECSGKAEILEKIKKIDSGIKSIEKNLAAFEKQAQELQKQISETEKNEAELKALAKQKEDLIHKHNVVKKRIQVTEVSLEDTDAKLKQKVLQIFNRIEEARLILDKKPEIDLAEKTLPQALKTQADLERQKKETQENIKKVQLNLDKHNEEKLKVSLQHNKYVKALEMAEKAKEILEGVNCDNKGWVNESCKFIKDAIHESANIESYRKRKEEAEEYNIKLDGNIDQLKAGLEEFESMLAGIEEDEIIIVNSIIELKQVLQLKSHLENSEKNIEQLQADLRNERLDGEKKIQDLKDNLEDLIYEGNECEAKVRDINEQLAKKEIMDIDILIRDFKAAKFGFDENNRVLQEANIQKGQFQNQLESILKSEGDAINLRKEISVLQDEISDWNILSKAFGKDGIQALEIDSAAPDISAIINELLYSCYGSQFSVKFETTKLKADGKAYKEVFDLKVFDEGVERKIENLSGGEKVIISEALSLAISIFNARRSGIRWENLFRDETAGALDPQNASRYVAMLRKAMEIGSFKKIIFIAHQPEVWSLADAQVHFKDGQIQI